MRLYHSKTFYGDPGGYICVCNGIICILPCEHMLCDNHDGVLVHDEVYQR